MRASREAIVTHLTTCCPLAKVHNSQSPSKASRVPIRPYRVQNSEVRLPDVAVTCTRRYNIVAGPNDIHPIALAPAMTLTSTAEAISIFKDGKLKPGFYKIQNIVAETFLDCEVHTKEMCCRPANELGEGKGLVSLSLSPA